LKPDQRQVHNIIARHLDAHLAGQQPTQLLMLVQGAGGTGKTFAEHNTGGMLAKTSMMGMAASLIQGVTLHMWAGIPCN
ncbi:hypothetical protein L208DRAFT_1074372, partial [Tricholoma matsutake]